ncbi:MAG: hypothetical protein ACRC5C_09245 [Bacilli bacterium]
MSRTDGKAQKYTDFSEAEIDAYLSDFKQLVREGRYTIQLNENRTENVDFMVKYNLDMEKAKEMLLLLDVFDFCYAADNAKSEFAHEKLYVFCRAFELDNWGTTEHVDIYIKSNIIQTRKGAKRLFIVSFHKRNNPITYCFK